MYNFLTTHQDDEKYRYAMVGYELGNTLTENGSVARGVCVTDENGYLKEIAERTKIVKTAEGRGLHGGRRGHLDASCAGHPGIHEYVGLFREHSG